MTVDNKFIVHANIPSHTALFENCDYTSSFYMRDINEKLVDYHLECAGESGNRNAFVNRFDLPENTKSETDLFVNLGACTSEPYSAFTFYRW